MYSKVVFLQIWFFFINFYIVYNLIIGELGGGGEEIKLQNVFCLFFIKLIETSLIIRDDKHAFLNLRKVKIS